MIAPSALSICLRVRLLSVPESELLRGMRSIGGDNSRLLAAQQGCGGTDSMTPETYNWS